VIEDWVLAVYGLQVLLAITATSQSLQAPT
jgi:hypothetical protein